MEIHLFTARLRHHLGIIPTLIALLIPFSTFDAAFAQTEGTVTLDVAPGLDGYCRESSWFPVLLTLENDGPDLEGLVVITLPGSTGGEVGYAQNIFLPRQSRKEVRLSIYAQGFFNDLEASFLVGAQAVVQKSFRVNCVGEPDTLFGILSDTPSGFNRLLDADPPAGAAFVAHITTADLPTHFQALQPLSMLIISDTDTSVLSEEQLRALTGWLASGGHLLVTGGPDWQKTTSGLAELLPLEPTHTQTIPNLAPLSRLVGDDDRLTSETIVTQGLLKPGAQVLASLNGAPLLLQRPLGGGLVSFLAVNPSLSPLDSWENLPDLFQYLLDRQGISLHQNWLNGFQSWSDANAAISIIPGLAFPSVILICGLLVLYPLTVGPINYLILRRWGHKEFAWISIPGLVLLFGGLAFIVGGQTRGASPVLNRVAVIQTWPGTPFGRMDALIGVFSPTRNTFDLELQGDFLAHPVPGDFGSPVGDWRFIQELSRLIIPEMQIESGGLASFVMSGLVPAPAVTHSLRYQLGPLAQTAAGDLRLETGFQLKDAVVLTPGGVYPLGDISPGTSYPVNIDLTRSTAFAAGIKPQSPDPEILTLIEEIIGVPYYSGRADEQTRLRVSLLTSLMDPFGPSRPRPPDIFLAGWSEADLPFQAAVPGQQLVLKDLTFYLIALKVPLETDTQLTIPPGLFSWTLMSPSPGQQNVTLLGPYDTFLPPGTTFELQYQLNPELPFGGITNLSMRLETDQDGITPPQIAIFNNSTGIWQNQPVLDWGLHNLENPANLIGPLGNIRVRIDLPPDHPGVFLRALDFTMVLNTGDF